MSAFMHGLFGCFDDFGICIITFIVPCITAGNNAEAVNENCCLYAFLSLLGPISLWSRASIRGKIREAKNIDGSFMNDCIIHWLCGACALVQEAQEVQGIVGGSMARE